ncbi:transporter substrate-binding domain-containing protein [Paenibacillus sp. CMAA1739]|uniref:transporter substrate-binding domain-containing protein n=1 Tax=Paenibacillus ottowii TaxID=2315729 RepID=UPI00272F4964|nr:MULTISPECIES: transporter substrate-binding domain-containing protein [Paenibacillus]MDP1510809.1 transporter substrate-binding domain-containing protein [Paenibacillus ottowii]MEC4566695.1 transporter substrate-binding domain-containing protein [Paenibacillus sp. CMAA1739]
MKKWFAILSVMAIILVLAGCGSSDDTSSASGSSRDVKKIIVGTGTQFKNVCFIDENGNLTGFDVELIKELDKRLPQYEFEFKTMDFGNLLLSLDAGKIDMVSHQMEKNPEREAKYLFNKNPYSIFLNRVAVAKDNNSIHSIDDLKGKKVLTSPTSNAAYVLKEYNKTHGNALNIVYTSGAANDTVQQITSGRIDATITTDFANRFNTDEKGEVALKTVGDPLTQSDVLYVLNKNEQGLADDLDKAIQEVKDDGTLSKLSIKWLGEDFTKSLEDVKKEGSSSKK